MIQDSTFNPIKMHRQTVAAKKPTAAKPGPGSMSSAPAQAPMAHASAELLQQYAGVRFGHHKPADEELTTDILGGLKKAEQTRFDNSKEVLTFKEFIQDVIKTPQKHLRNSSQYTVDAMDYYNKEAGVSGKTINVLGHDVQPMAYIRRPWEPDEMTQKNQISGQELILNQMYTTLKQNAKKKHPTRMFMLHGPNGTGKTLALETLFAALENYSKTDGGSLYSFNWVFRDGQEDESGFDILTPVPKGHPGQTGGEDGGTPAIKPEEVGVTIPANLHTNPIFLLDKQQRLQILNKLEKADKLPEGFNKDFVIAGKLDSSSQKIYDALWKLYNGDIEKVLSHVQVVRWNMSEQNRQGLVNIPPEDTMDAALQPITPDIDWNTLPNKIKDAFRSAGIHQLEGPFPKANRGHILYDDQWKSSNAARYLFLLKTGEKGKMTISGGMRGAPSAVEEDLDLNIWSTVNDSNIANLQQQYPDWKSMKERITPVPVGYERRYQSVKGIYKNDLKQLLPADGRVKLDPHLLEAFSMFNTLTVLFPPSTTSYYDKTVREEDKPLFRKALDKLKNEKEDTLLYKALLYQGEDLNDFELDATKQKFTPDEQRVLRKYLKDIAEEYNFGLGKHKFLFYEGGIGLSPRDGKEMLEEAIRKNKNNNFTVVELFDFMAERIQHGLDFEQERNNYVTAYKQASEQAKKGGFDLGIEIPKFQPAMRLLDQTKTHVKRKIRYDVNEAMGVIKPEEEHLKTLRKYLEHVKAFRAKRDVPTSFRHPEFQAGPSESFMRQIEAILDPTKLGDLREDKSSDRNEFRKGFSETLALWVGDHAGQKPEENLGQIFANHVQRMQARDIQDNKKRLLQLLQDMPEFLKDKERFRRSTAITSNPERLEILEKTLGNLARSEKGYDPVFVAKLIDFAYDPAEMTALRTEVAALDKKAGGSGTSSSSKDKDYWATTGL